ncbi:2-methoxy-6-polyprenyl-14-benzoquinol methylase mitochondrial [Zea mays]|uniref:2-methoxy-6-polyprenyl-14-benzoquinol methylase mitochondrial n=1 Tax=Zea mays TaxID=4577 RepID=A0A1D6KGG9_MAIZE|nr:2-methoxy-6-polyprenyl-14-benzoquinol methylase mitochondrial [Zea mays]
MWVGGMENVHICFWLQ